MSQKARPVADVQNVVWVPSPVYPEVNEEDPDDNTYVTSSGIADVTGDVFVVKLPPVSWPLPGDQVLQVRLAKELGGSGGSGGSGGDDPMWVLITLLQGSTTIASRYYLPDEIFTTVSLVLSADAKRLIFYDELLLARNLLVRVQTLPPISVSCCPNKVSQVLSVAFGSGTGTLACMNGYAAHLPWAPNQSAWGFSIRLPACGDDDSVFSHVVVVLSCSGEGMVSLSLSGAINGTFNAPVDCASFTARFSNLASQGGGLPGTIDVVVTGQ